MQPVGTDHEVELARGTVLEGDEHAGCSFVDGRNAIIKKRLDTIFDGPVYCRSKIAARHGREAIVHSLAKNIGGESAHLSTAFIHNPQFPNRVSVLSHLRQNAHPFRNRVAHAPEINRIPVSAKLRSFFDQHDLMAVTLK